MVDNTYRFLSNEEPTDEQLEGLMTAAAEEAKKRADAANAKYRQMHEQQTQEMKAAWQQKQTENGKK